MDWAKSNNSISENIETALSHVVLIMGTLKLVIPQPQVYALEPAIDVVYSDENTVGMVTVDDADWPVYCLSEELGLLQKIPKERRICTILYAKGGLFGLLCDQVILADWLNDALIIPLPICTRTVQTRLQGLMLHGEEVLCMVSAQELFLCCLVAESDGLAY